MSEETLFESEHETDRTTVAAYLRSLADGIETGADLEFAEDAVVSVPATAAFGVELEREGDEVELEFEIEWSGAASGAGADDAEETDRAVETGESPTASDAEAPTASEGTSPTASGGDASDGGGDADVLDATLDAVDLADPAAGGEASQATFEVYRDRADEWRWRLVHRNGNVIADSGEGYGRRGTAENGLHSVKRNAPGAPIEYPEE